jgi:hypothetical protein
VKEEFNDLSAVSTQMRLQFGDGTIPVTPEMLTIARVFWEILSVQDLRVNARNEHFFIIRAIENTNSSAFREPARGAPFKSLTLYVANFDTEKALKKSLGVIQQSTIVVFKDGKEIARSTGDTQRDRLDVLLKQAVS